MKKWWYGTAVPVGAALLVASPALADSYQNLGKMVISANRVETALEDVGSSVSVVTSEDLEKKQALTLEDALEGIPGLDVYSNGNSQMRQRMTLRGQDMQHIVFIVDGVKIENQASSMYSNPYSHLSVSDIERIEVLRGNQSALYGSDAIGGAIIITTKSGQNSTKMIEGEAGAEIGSYQTHKASARVSGRIDDVYYKVSGTRFETDGYDITAREGGSTNEGSSNSNLALKVGMDALKDVGVLDLLNVEGSFNRQDGVADSDSSGSESANMYWLDTSTSRVQVKANMFDGLLDNTFAASRMDSYVYAGYRGSQPSGSHIPKRYFGDLEKYEYQGVLRPVENHTFVFGTEQERDHYRYVTSKAADMRNESLVNSSVFGNWGMAFLDKALNINLGTREDFHDTFGEHNTYRATVSYAIRSTGTRPHASYGTGFKAPMLAQLYGKSGTETLKPEESRGFDLGVEQTLLDGRLQLDVTVFKTDMSNAIILEGGTATGKYKNLTSTRAMGVENSINFEVNHEWSLSGTHTYQESRDNGTDSRTEYQPKHAGSLRVNYTPDEVAGLRTWVRMKASSARLTGVGSSTTAPDNSANRSGGFTVWDLGADYEVDERITVYGRVENLFDKYYSRYYGSNYGGIAAYTGLRMKF